MRDNTSIPTTRLGDWYANLLFTKSQHLIVCVSERSLLPIFRRSEGCFVILVSAARSFRSLL